MMQLTRDADDLKDVIQHLFEIQSAVHGYLGPETQQELVRKMYVSLNGTLNPTSTPMASDDMMRAQQSTRDNSHQLQPQPRHNTTSVYGPQPIRQTKG